MNYTFKNTEINNKKATDFETKSLLYLIGKRKDSKEVEYIAFDCFNDVSGINKKSDKIWDIQSKNEKNLNPKKIGKYFFTLFDNFTSTFDFKEFIFFCPVLKSEYKIDDKLNTYGIENIEDKTLTRIKNGLNKEVIRVKGTSINYNKEQEEFLEKVIIVEDTELDNEYIKTVTKFKKTEIKTDAFYQSVFQDLRDIQSSKKNSYIENEIITNIKDVLKFNRHLFSKDVETLIISRIIGCEVFESLGYKDSVCEKITNNTIRRYVFVSFVGLANHTNNYLNSEQLAGYNREYEEKSTGMKKHHLNVVPSRIQSIRHLHLIYE
jgi:hypothetical protein